VAALVKVRGEIVEARAQNAAPKAVQDTTIPKHTLQHRSSFPAEWP
jgi:hypothetical protein